MLAAPARLAHRLPRCRPHAAAPAARVLALGGGRSSCRGLASAELPHPSTSAGRSVTWREVVVRACVMVAGWTGTIWLGGDYVPELFAVHGYLGIVVTQAICFPACAVAYARGGEAAASEMKERWMGRALYHWMRAVGAWDVSVEGTERLRGQAPCVLVCNHASFCDNVLLTLVPLPKRFLTKSLYYSIPVFGWSQLLAGDVEVDLSSPESRKQSVQNCLATIRSRQASVVVYPEGTRSTAPPHMNEFKAGAFRIAVEGGVQVLPVVVLNSHHAMDRWLGARKARMRVIVLPPVDVKGKTVDEVQAEVRARMEAAITKCAGSV